MFTDGEMLSLLERAVTLTCSAKAVDADCGALLFRLAFVTGAGGRVVCVAPEEQDGKVCVSILT